MNRRRADTGLWRRRVHAVRMVGTLVVLLVAGFASQASGQVKVLRLATTTSTADTGLLGAILPSFEKQCGCRVHVVAVGTGQALELGRRGDADVVLVHAFTQEQQFVAEGHARERFDVMYNDFVIVGPTRDPARIRGASTAREAFGVIARAQAPFASRGDKSGTHTAELALWKAAGISTAGQSWYRSLGQGMGETLTAAEEQEAYTLSDRGTYLAMRDRLPHLTVLVGGSRLSDNPDPALRNRYGIMAVSARMHPGVAEELATAFVKWFVSLDTQHAIGAFGRNRFGQPLYYPDSQAYRAWKTAQPSR
jgi:tungstate transport system substrate-binding protein